METDNADASIGALAAGFTGDLLGRRWGLIFACTVFNVGAAMQTAAAGLPLFIAGRVVAGLGVGLVSALGEPAMCKLTVQAFV